MRSFLLLLSAVLLAVVSQCPEEIKCIRGTGINSGLFVSGNLLPSTVVDAKYCAIQFTVTDTSDCDIAAEGLDRLTPPHTTTGCLANVDRNGKKFISCRCNDAHNCNGDLSKMGDISELAANEGILLKCPDMSSAASHLPSMRSCDGNSQSQGTSAPPAAPPAVPPPSLSNGNCPAKIRCIEAPGNGRIFVSSSGGHKAVAVQEVEGESCVIGFTKDCTIAAFAATTSSGQLGTCWEETTGAVFVCACNDAHNCNYDPNRWTSEVSQFGISCPPIDYSAVTAKIEPCNPQTSGYGSSGGGSGYSGGVSGSSGGVSGSAGGVSGSSGGSSGSGPSGGNGRPIRMPEDVDIPVEQPNNPVRPYSEARKTGLWMGIAVLMAVIDL